MAEVRVEGPISEERVFAFQGGSRRVEEDYTYSILHKAIRGKQEIVEQLVRSHGEEDTRWGWNGSMWKPFCRERECWVTPKQGERCWIHRICVEPECSNRVHMYQRCHRHAPEGIQEHFRTWRATYVQTEEYMKAQERYCKSRKGKERIERRNERRKLLRMSVYQSLCRISRVEKCTTVEEVTEHATNTEERTVKCEEDTE